jgi:microcystin-dependent protein
MPNIENRLTHAVGEVAFFANNSSGTPNVPDGWLHCNGAAYPPGKYANLYNAIGEYFGYEIQPNGDRYFKVPDLYTTGMFMRSTGATGALGFGLPQEDAMQRIQGNFSRIPRAEGYSAPTGVFAGSTSGSVAWSSNTSYAYADMVFDSALVTRTSFETRPVNMAFVACIKY